MFLFDTSTQSSQTHHTEIRELMFLLHNTRWFLDEPQSYQSSQGGKFKALFVCISQPELLDLSPQRLVILGILKLF